MKWSFLGGMADYELDRIRQDESRKAEWAEYEKRIKLGQQLAEEAEARKAKSRLIVQGEDLNKGVAYEQTAGGEYTEYALPQNYVEGRRAQAALAAEKERLDRERDERKFQSGLDKDQASIRASDARAAASNASASAIPSLIEQRKAQTEKARREAGDGGQKPATLSEERAYSNDVARTSDSIIQRAAGVQDSELKKVVEEARREALQERDPIKRLQALREVEALVAGYSDQALGTTGSTPNLQF